MTSKGSTFIGSQLEQAVRLIGTPRAYFAALDSSAPAKRILLELGFWGLLAGIFDSILISLALKEGPGGWGMNLMTVLVFPFFMILMFLMISFPVHSVARLLGGKTAWTRSLQGVGALAIVTPLQVLLGALPLPGLNALIGIYMMFLVAEGLAAVHGFTRARAWGGALLCLLALVLIFAGVGLALSA